MIAYDRLRPPATARVILCVALLAAGCDAGLRDTNIVARAGDHELSVEELATWLGESRKVPLERDVVERFAHRWIEYSLVAQRLAAGDSLLDSATVIRANWPDVHRRIVDRFHETLMNERLRVDSTALDSAYVAGELRSIQHILLRATPNMTDGQRATLRRRAESLRAGLTRGGSWAEANAQNDDPTAKRDGGSIGIITRGQTVPEFDTAAFALAPGEISPVTETTYGYHVIRRPELNEVREQFQQAIRERAIERMDSLYMEELDERWNIALDDDAPAAVRRTIGAAFPLMEDDQVLGTYRGGKFRVGDLVRWMHLLPPQMMRQLSGANDEQLGEFVRSLIRNELIARDAAEAGVTLTAEEFTMLAGTLETDLTMLRSKLGLDGDTVPGPTALEAAVDGYVERIAMTLQDIVLVSPFLAAELRERSKWRVSSAAIDRVLALATTRRDSLDAARRGADSSAAGDTREGGGND